MIVENEYEENIMWTLNRLGLADEPEIESSYCCEMCNGGWVDWDDGE